MVDSFAHQIALIADYVQDELKKEIVKEPSDLPQLKEVRLKIGACKLIKNNLATL